MLKRIISAIMIVSVIFLATGCGGSSPKSIEDARKYFEKEGWEINDELTSSIGVGVVKAINASKGAQLNATYMELENSDLAKEGFKEALSQLGDMLKKEKESKKYSRYEADLMGMN